MYILKNAGISIIRNKGRNILIAIIIIIIAFSCAISLAILNSANTIVKAYESKYVTEASISINRDKLMQNFRDNPESNEGRIEKFNEIAQITKEEIIKYGDSKYVSSYYYTYQTSVNSTNIEKATDSISNDQNIMGMPGGKGPGEEIKNNRLNNGDFELIGYSSYEAMSDFISGKYTISEGEVNSDFSSNTCVISNELASINSLNVGDVIKVVNPNNESLVYELKISGIYTENSEESKNMQNMFSNSANQIITNVNFIETMISDDESLNTTITPTFILTSSEVVDNFANEVSEKGLSEYYSVTNNLETVTEATKSITNVKTFATIFLIIILLIGSVVLLVLNMINIRERRYEIGVLRTIGMKKIYVIFQFMCELLIVCLVSLVIGTGLGAISSVPIANKLLASEIENSKNQFENINNNFGGNMPNMERPDNKGGKMEFNGVANVEQVNDINAVVDFKVVLQLLVIGVVLTIISSASSMIAINRFSPLTILKERS